MPSTSRRQQRLMALAYTSPDKVSDKNKGVLKMSKEQRHEFMSLKDRKKR